ncbi:MAG: hypothetical protein IPL46_14985 [Saprospiraceae bacterium]|nr:hypothetical protein [Saprospiraceae bacterium]
MKKDIICKYISKRLLTKDVNIVKLIDDESLKIIMRGEIGGEEFTIAFKNPIAFRSINSFFMDKIWTSLGNELEGNILYEYKNSTFVDYSMELSLGIYQDYKIRHFAIYGGEMAIDVLSVQEPEIIENV